MKNSELPLYQPPRARDLSASTLSGAPLGLCQDGTFPYSDCGAGFSLGTGSDCAPGGSPTGNQCWPLGSIADATCGEGGYA